MANYREVSGEGIVWKRCCQISISNPVLGNKLVSFVEENAAQIGDNVVRGGTTSDLVELVNDMTKVIPLRDPATGELTGQSITYGDVYVSLYSAYMQCALARDAALGI